MRPTISVQQNIWGSHDILPTGGMELIQTALQAKSHLPRAWTASKIYFLTTANSQYYT